MGSEDRTSMLRKGIKVEIDETLFLQERVYTDYCINITHKVTATGSGGEILIRVCTPCLNDEVAVALVDLRSFRSLGFSEEFWERLHLDIMDILHGKPSCTSGLLVFCILDAFLFLNILTELNS